MAYLGNSPINRLYSAQAITLSQGQTAVNVNYTPGLTLFFKNGVLLDPSIDYTATNGSVLTLASAATAGDVLTGINLASFAVANALPLGGGILTGPVNGITPDSTDASTLLATTEFVQGLLPFRVGSPAVYATAGNFTWNKPDYVSRALAIVTGSGGKGGVSNTTGYRGAGGSAGGTAIKLCDLSGVSSVSVTVSDGNASTTSSFGTFCSGTGGSNGADYTGGGAPAGGAPGAGTGGDINLRGGYGSDGTGGGSGNGGASFWGGGSRSSSTSALTPLAPGSGGGGTDGNSRGNGSLGIVVILY